MRTPHLKQEIWQTTERNQEHLSDMEEDKIEPAGQKTAKEARMDQSQFLEEFYAAQNKFIKHIVASLDHLNQAMSSQTEMMAQHYAEFRKRQMQKLETLQDILNNNN